MEQEIHACPSCGAHSSDLSPCPYCGWNPERIDESNLAEYSSSTDPDAVPEAEPAMDLDEAGPANSKIKIEDAAEVDETTRAQFRDLVNQGDQEEYLLDQVPEEMRGVLAARLKAADETDGPNFSDTTASALREQGYLISEDARGARLAATTGHKADLSPSDVVKMAAELDGGVQPQTKLSTCEKCQAASPVGDTHCQWCGEPFSDEQ